MVRICQTQKRKQPIKRNNWCFISGSVQVKKKTDVGKIIGEKTTNIKKSLLSKVLNISKRNLYYQNTKQTNKDLILKDQILSVLESNPAYGHRRIAMALNFGKKRVRRVMRLNGIKPYKRKARWTKKRDYGKPDSGFPNLIKGSCPIKPKVIFAGDFTRLSWNGKIVYLATFIDLYTREIVGWSVSIKHTNDLVIDAYLDAVRNLGRSLIVHTDQGSEYTSKEYIDIMLKLGVKISMSKKGSPWENGYQESYYDNFKTDLGLEFERFITVGEFVEAIHQTINYYNKRRIHTALKMSPYHFKQKFLNLPV